MAFTGPAAQARCLVTLLEQGRMRRWWVWPRLGGAAASRAARVPRRALTGAVLLEAMAALVLAVVLAGTSNTALATSARLARLLDGQMPTRGSRHLMQAAAVPPDGLAVQLVGISPSTSIPGFDAGFPTRTGDAGGSPILRLKDPVSEPPATPPSGKVNSTADKLAEHTDRTFEGGAGGGGSGDGSNVPAPTIGSGGPMPADQDIRGLDSNSTTAFDSSSTGGGATDVANPTGGSSNDSTVAAAVQPPDIVATTGPNDEGEEDYSASSGAAGASGGGGVGEGGGNAAAADSKPDVFSGVDGWPCDWRRAHKDCTDGYSCIPSSSNSSYQGTCTANPVGGNPIPADFGYPVVFYPLTNGSLSAWPPGSGSAYDGLIVQGNVYSEGVKSSNANDLFPGAITCDQGSSSLIAIPGLTYGRSGAFTINFWMRKRPEDTATGLDDEESYDSDNEDIQRTTNVSNGSEAWSPPVFEYMLTHANLQPLSPRAAKFTPMDRNQIAVYLIPRTSQLYGIARAYVKDSNDGRGPVFLDSDGLVADNGQIRPEYRPWNLTDGDWHMLTISSQPEGGRGWRMYVDGSLAVQIPSSRYPPGGSSIRGRNVSLGAEIDGGDPLFLGGPLLLCGRYGGPYSRAYGGQLANLAVFDAALNAAQIMTLYEKVRDPGAVQPPKLPLSRHPWYGSTLLTPPEWLEADESDERLANEYGTLTGTPVAAPVMTLDVASNASGGGGGGGGDASRNNTSRESFIGSLTEALAEALVEALTGVSYNRSAGMTCSLDLRRERGLSFCEAGLVCAPVSASFRTKPLDAWMSVTGDGDNSSSVYSPAAAAAAIDAAASASALLGVCSPPASGMLLPGAWPADWPAPAAHFPLTRGSLRSWPAGAYGARLSNATWTLDSRFGQVVQCDRNSKSRVVLDAVPYGSRGPMAVNLWVRTNRADLTPRSARSISGLQYVFSHAAGGPFVNFGPNQVHMYIPEVGSPLYGISVRAILRDGDDMNLGRPSEVYLDSDGSVGNDQPRQWAPRDDGVDVADGGWHMLTVSSNWSSPGYSIYVDGVMRGQLMPGAVRSTTNMSDTVIQITGGSPMQLSGPIVLCGRSDGDPDRHFSGSVAALSLFDAALQPWQVAALYGNYQRQAVLMPAGQVMRGAGYISATTTTGDPCVFPLSYGGRTMYGCIMLDSLLSCPVENGSIAPCAVNRQPGVVPADVVSEDVVSYNNSGNSSSSSSSNDEYPGGSGSASALAANSSGATALLQQLMSYNLANGVMLGPAGGAMPRLTVGGQLCVFPFVLDNVTYNNCANTAGVEFCPTLDLDADPEGHIASLMECAPAVVRPPDSTRCKASLAPYSRTRGDSDEEGGPDEESPWSSSGGVSGGEESVTGMQEREFSQCINMMGVDSCQTQEGLWLICPPPPRLTATGAVCQVPYKLGILLRTDCVVPVSAVAVGSNDSSSGNSDNGSSSGSATSRRASSGIGGIGSGDSSVQGREVCPGSDGDAEICVPTYVPPPTLQPRLPIRFTLDRQRCLPPGPGALSECADYGAVARTERTFVGSDILAVADDPNTEGRYSCEVEGGDILECAPVERVTLGGVGRSPEVCSFPFLYRGRNRTDCVWLEGVEACKVADGSWAECSPQFITRFPEVPDNLILVPRHSVSGQPCALPFFYNGSLQWDCVARDTDPGICRTVNGRWEACMPRVQEGKSRTTITGQDCQLPFYPPPALAAPVPPGTLPQPAYDCVGPPPGSCLNSEGRLEPCAPRPRTTASGTGEPCYLPYTFRNITYYDCFTPQPDVAAAAIAAAAATTAGSDAPSNPKPNTTATQEFCSVVAVARDPSELKPCVPLDPQLPQPNAGFEPSTGSSAVSAIPPSDFGAESGSEFGSDSSAKIATGSAGYSSVGATAVTEAADAGEAARKRRDLGLGLGLGVGLPGLMLLIAGLAALRRHIAKSHMSRVLREMRMDAPAPPPPPPAASTLLMAGCGVPLPLPSSSSQRGGNASAGSSGNSGGYGSGTMFGTFGLSGFAGPTSKTLLPPARGDAAAEVEMSPGGGGGGWGGGFGSSYGAKCAPPPASPPPSSPLPPSPPQDTVATPLLPASSIGSHSSERSLQAATSVSGADNATTTTTNNNNNNNAAAVGQPSGPPSLQLTGSSLGASSAANGLIRPPRPAPPPPFVRSSGGNAFASGQLSPTSSLGGGGGSGGSIRTNGAGAGGAGSGGGFIGVSRSNGPV